MKYKTCPTCVKPKENPFRRHVGTKLVDRCMDRYHDEISIMPGQEEIFIFQARKKFRRAGIKR